MAIPSSAIVEANGKNLVYVQNGDAFDGIEVTLGQTSGDLVEIKTGLFDGDLIVTQRASQLYAQSLRGGSHPQQVKEQNSNEVKAEKATSIQSFIPSQMTQWLPLIIGGY